MTKSDEAMKKLYSHIQILTQEAAKTVNEDVLWEGLMRFVREPEKFNEQISSSTVTPGAADRAGTVFERTLDFGTHRVKETVYLNKNARLLEFHVQETKDYPSSCLRMEVSRTPQQLPAVTFSYFATSEPKVPASLRPLIEKAWEEKDKAILERILLDALESDEH